MRFLRKIIKNPESRWQNTLDSLDKAYEVLGKIQKEIDSDRVIVYSLGKDTSLTKPLRRTIMQEIDADNVERVGDTLVTELVDEKSLFFKLIIKRKKVLEAKKEDMTEDNLNFFNRFKIKTKKIYYLGIKNDNMLIFSIHNARKDSPNLESLIKELISCYN